MLTYDHSIVICVLHRCWWTSYLTHSYQYWGIYACSNLCSPRSHSQATVVPGRYPRTAPHSNCHISLLTPLIEVFLSILESSHYKLRTSYGLTLMSPNPVGGRRSQRPWPSPTLGSLGSSHHWHHKSQVPLRAPPCAHGVSGIPYKEVRDNLFEWGSWKVHWHLRET